MRRIRPYWWVRIAALSAVVVVVVVVLVIAGVFREELGPVRFPTTTVAGVVREGGRPVGGGWIEFLPIEGTVGNLRSAPIANDGTFEATGVAVGTNRIGLIAAPIGAGSRRLFHTAASPIRREVPPGLAARLTIDLLEETIRHQRQTIEETKETSR